jgi:hypothetical protein
VPVPLPLDIDSFRWSWEEVYGLSSGTWRAAGLLLEMTSSRMNWGIGAKIEWCRSFSSDIWWDISQHLHAVHLFENEIPFVSAQLVDLGL